jgi:Zn-dependent M16 (insulinase) family peptidase
LLFFFSIGYILKFFFSLDLNQHEDGLLITAHSLDRNINHMYDILKQLLCETNFDNIDKLRTIIYAVSINFINEILLMI